MSMIRVPCGDPLAGYQVPETKHPWQGAIRGAGPGADVTVSFGVHDVPQGAKVTADRYSIDLRPASYDMLAIARQPDGQTRIIMKRLVGVTGPGSLDLDFGTDGIAPRSRPVTLPAAAPGERLYTTVILVTERGAAGALFSPVPEQAPLLDETQLSGNDRQVVVVQAVTADGALRAVQLFVVGGTLPAFELPAKVTSASALLVARTPVARPRVSFQAPPGALFYQLGIAQLVPRETIRWVVNTSARWLAGNSTIELPDLSAVPGFAVDHGPAPDAPLKLELTAVTTNRRMDALLDSVLPATRGETAAFAQMFVPLSP
jgi:hypothetical protein